jgi:hypothetical protein
MPHFKVILSGRGIYYPFDGSSVVGFFTTRLVRAASAAQAESFAKELVSREWRNGGPYAAANRGSGPVLTVEQSFQVGVLAGFLGGKPSGYSFYRQED